MNKVILMGRLTRDPEMRHTASNLPVCTFTVAVDRRFKSQDGERKADFIDVVAWRQNAEFVSKYFTKGKGIVVVGSIQTRTWEDQQGQKRYQTEVVADELYFTIGEARRQEGGYDAAPTKFAQPNQTDDAFLSGDDEEMSLPFDL
ncbi:MAG TPA: single-stranded DNA-binding protein [Clostridiaceae bacterium]|jgi:single-strand DNA-binding protein|nr:single-stranded DNA-binding protein [Clostridiaceae bacterium]